MGLAECISQNDVCKTDCLFEIQTELVNNLKYEFLNGKNPPFVQEIYQELIDSFCSEKALKTAVRTYIKDMMESEDDDAYADDDHVIRKEVNQAAESQDSLIIRIGAYTGYFYKTVSWLFKKSFPTFYENDFYDFFSPVKFNPNKKGRPVPTPENMPRSVAILSSHQNGAEQGYLPGFIKVEL